MSEEKNTGAGKVGMAAFNVVEMSNEGVKLFLHLPDGTKTDEFIVVRGADSKIFRTHQARANREKVKATQKHNLLKKSEQDPAVLDKQLVAIGRRLVATLVADWSFEAECTEENVAKFLADAPQVQDQIDIFAGDRSNFFTKPPQD